MNPITYTSSTPNARRGWDAFDRMVEWAASASPSGTFGEVVERLPEGIHFPLISDALRNRAAGVVVGAIAPARTSAGIDLPKAA